MDSQGIWQSNDRLMKALVRSFEKTYLSHTTDQLGKLLWLVSRHQSQPDQILSLIEDSLKVHSAED